MPVHFRNGHWPSRNWHYAPESSMIYGAGCSGWAFAFFSDGCSMVLNGTMRKPQLGAVCALALSCALVVPASAQDASPATTHKPTTAKKSTSTSTHQPHTSSGTSSSTAKKTSSRSSSKRSSHRKRVRGQQKIDSDRARSIQEALIRQHYLNGEPTGTWNQASEDAMRKYQADHGWQSKTVPDSRALISLGLGPSKDHLLNPESAMTTVPDAPKSETSTPASHRAPATASPPTPASASTTTATPTSNDPSSPQ